MSKKDLIRSAFVFCMMFVFSVSAWAKDAQSDERKIYDLTAAQVMKGQTAIMVPDVYEIVKEKNAGYLIVSMQPLDEYRRGHVPGAVHMDIDMRNIKATADKLPKDKIVILVSSNGQEACKVGFVLRQLGYDVRAMLLGMNAYNRFYAGTGAYTGDVDGDVSIEPVEFKPSANKETFSDMSAEQLVIKNTSEYAGRNRPFDVTAYDILQMGDDVLLLSLQSAEDYALGHIPGTVNMPAPDFFMGDKRILSLPKDKKIIVTCYLGHYSSFAAMFLNQLGYDAYSLKWGALGWNDALVQKVIKMVTNGMHYEVEASFD